MSAAEDGTRPSLLADKTCISAVDKAFGVASTARVYRPQTAESPVMLGRLVFDLVVLTSGLSIIIFTLVTAVAELI
jgi:hypothetical protein